MNAPAKRLRSRLGSASIASLLLAPAGCSGEASPTEVVAATQETTATEPSMPTKRAPATPPPGTPPAEEKGDPAAAPPAGADGSPVPADAAPPSGPAATPAPAGANGSPVPADAAPPSGPGARGTTRPKPKPTPKPAAAPKPAPAVDGRAVFMKKCKTCHGVDGKADTKMGRKHEIPDMTAPDWDRKWPKAKIIEIIRGGKSGTKMRAFEDKLSPEEIDAVATFVRSL